MDAQDPNRLPWQGLYSWTEPVAGSRHEWKSDHWRFWKIGACLVPVFFVCAWVYGSITLHFVECMAGVAAFTFVYFWGRTFLPRFITLFKDKIAVMRGGSKYMSASIEVYYSEIKQMEVVSAGRFYSVKLTLASGKKIALYARDKRDLDALKEILKGFPITSADSTSQPTGSF